MQTDEGLCDRKDEIQQEGIKEEMHVRNRYFPDVSAKRHLLECVCLSFNLHVHVITYYLANLVDVAIQSR